MAYDFRDYKVKIKNTRLQTFAFVLMLFTALFAIGFGVSMLIRKEPGYETVKAYPNDEAPQYSSNYILNYYYEGSSSEIKLKTKEVEEAYSSALLLSYKLLDAENDYEGFKNISYINEHKGEWIKVSDTLFDILKDAYEKTKLQEGYNMFAGALYKHWESILILDDINEFDPLINDEEAKRISALSKRTNDLSNFNLEFNDTEKEIRFSVSKEYMDFCIDQEENDRFLNLNLLKDAYITKVVSGMLEKAGLNKGFFVTNSGISYVLSGINSGKFAFYAYDFDKNEIVLIDSYGALASHVCAGITYFPITDNKTMYHTVESEGKTYLRSPFVNVSEEGFTNKFSSSYVISKDGDVVLASYTNVILLNSINLDNVIDSLKSDTNLVVKIY